MSAPEAEEQTETIVVLALAALAALAVKVPSLFGLEWGADMALFRNVSFFVLPILTGYFVWKRRLSPRTWTWLALAFGAAVLFANVYPFKPGSDTEVLTVLHLPIALWLLVGVAYAGGRWGESAGRMDFVRFSGELFIYYALIALGGGVLVGFTMGMFQAIGIDAEPLVQKWLVPCGMAGAVIVGSWLVEAKQSVIENMAPVLTRIFTPLFALTLLAFLGTMVWTGRGIDIERNALIAFDLLLVLVLGLLLYSISARDPRDAARRLRPAAGAAPRQRAGRRCLRPGGDRGPDLGVRLHAQPRGRAGRERDPAGEPGLVHRALRPVSARPRLLCRPGALADGVPAGVLSLGRDRRHRLPTAVSVQLNRSGRRHPKNNGRPQREPAVIQINEDLLRDLYDVLCRGALLALHDIEFDSIAFGQALEALA